MGFLDPLSLCSSPDRCALLGEGPAFQLPLPFLVQRGRILFESKAGEVGEKPGLLKVVLKTAQPCIIDTSPCILRTPGQSFNEAKFEPWSYSLVPIEASPAGEKHLGNGGGKKMYLFIYSFIKFWCFTNSAFLFFVLPRSLGAI